MRRGAKITAWILGVLLLLILLPGYPPLFAGLICLVAGWITYLAQVGPRIAVSWEGVGLLAVCLALATAVGHGFCRWLWQGTGHEGPWRPRWTISGLAVIVLMFAAGMAVTGVAHQAGWLIRSPESLTRGEGSERNASSSLKTIASAQADFRGNDRDGNGKNDFWRGDIAGLFALKPAGSNEPIKLIEISVAGADDTPVTDIRHYFQRGPKAGHWFRALKFRGETTPDPDRFAACAFPASNAAGKWTFIISEENTIYRRLFTGSPPEFYPDDPIKEGWTRLD